MEGEIGEAASRSRESRRTPRTRFQHLSQVRRICFDRRRIGERGGEVLREQRVDVHVGGAHALRHALQRLGAHARCRPDETSCNT